MYLTIVSQLLYLESGCLLALLLERWPLLVEVLSTVPSRVCSKVKEIKQSKIEGWSRGKRGRFCFSEV